MLRKLFIHASNVHQGGGKSLLTTILKALPSHMDTVLSLDVRMPLDMIAEKNTTVRKVRPTISSRFFSELWLTKTVSRGDTVLCFGNLPPLFRVRGHAVVFVQNRYLVEPLRLTGFPFKTRFRLFAERCWLHWRIDNADVLIVQTPSMAKSLESLSRGRIPIQIMPFVDISTLGAETREPLDSGHEDKIDFLYVASGEPHKNHRRLIEAWCLLAEQGVFPSLVFTLDCSNFVELWTWIVQQSKRHDLRVSNTWGPHEQMTKLYRRTTALIYPSTMESFGLPLIEAQQAGLAILASELDYVRDVVDPVETFDPHSAVSIARAVKRFVGERNAHLPLLDGESFIQEVLATNADPED